jgi:hypothetical protein
MFVVTVDPIDEPLGGGATLFGRPIGGAGLTEGPDDVEKKCDEAPGGCADRTLTTSKNIQTSYHTCSAEYAIRSASL